MKKRKSILECKKAAAAVAVCLLSAALCAGCGADSAGYDIGYSNGSRPQTEAGSSSYDTDGYGAGFYGNTDLGESGGAVYEESQLEAPGDNGAGREDDSIRSERKLIETVTLEVETKEFEKMMSALELQIEGSGGYIESMNTYNGSRYSGYSNSRYADMTIRIPQAKLKGFLDTVSDVGNIVRRSDKVEDVTLSYVDMESRRNALRTEQERLMEFLDRAETVEEIIALEGRMSDVRYQLESMESQLRTIDNLVDYSTVYLNISEVQELTPVEEPTVWERITQGFGNSLYDIGQSATEACVWILIHIPYLLLWGAVLAAVILLLRRRRRKLLREKEAKEQADLNKRI